MKFSLALAALAAPLLAAAAAATVSPRALALNPSGPTRAVTNANVGLVARDVPETNAERMRRGLPIKAPHRRHHATPVGVARAESSPLPPTTYSGKLQVRKTDGTVLGYLTNHFNAFGEYGTFSDKSADAQIVSFSVPSSGGPFSVTAVGGGPVSSLPFIGAAVGFSNTNNNLASGSFNYAYLVAAENTEPGATPAEKRNSYAVATNKATTTAETAIWTYNTATHTIEPQWVNTDGSKPATHLVYTASQNVLSITGDTTSFSNAFGTSPEVRIYLV